MKKIILITGASSGIGKDTAKTLSKLGHTVYAAAPELEKMHDLKELGCIPLYLDITQEKDIQSVVDTVMNEQGGLDVLFNNAGYGVYGAIEDVSIEDARRQFEVNLFGLARIAQLILPSMRNKGTGTIINTSSIAGKVNSPMGGWYHATKHALEGWSDCLRLELAPHGIHVVIIEPGLIHTEFARLMSGQMMRRSGNGPYKEQAEGIEAATKFNFSKENASDPNVISQLVVEAINAKKPKTRYVGGKHARLLLFIRRILNDHRFDRFIMKSIERAKRRLEE